MSKNATKEEIEASEMVKEPVIIGFGDQINFMELFRCNGKRGLFTLRSQVNKAGMVNIMGFLDFNRTHTVKALDLTCLGRLVFNTYAGHEDLIMSDVFNNLFDYCHEEGNEKDINKLFLDDLIQVMVPNFDEDKFKRYHAEMVLNWYKEVFNKLKAIESEKEVKDDKQDTIKE